MLRKRNLLALAGLSFGLVVSGCGDLQDPAADDPRDAPGFRTTFQNLDAPCEIDVVDNDGNFIRRVDIEEEYIPGVVACENGGAPLEALKAQAVQARSFLYYKIFVRGADSIRNSTSDQVFSCSYRPNGPDEIHMEAARSTKGQYLTWEETIVASFYVAGAIPSNPDPNDPVGSCTAGPGDEDPTSTQDRVTYNWGKTACMISMTNLGTTPDDCRDNPHNRGAASQNGETCLANVGWKYQDMLKFYYGDDITLVNAEGTCGGPPPYELTDEDRFCGLKADGAYCMDNVAVTCADEFASMAEVCAEGCSDGTCVMAPVNNNAGNSSTGNNATGNSTTNNVTGNNTTGNSGTGGTGGTGGTSGEGGAGTGEFPALVDRSPGLSGGCSTGGDSGGLGGFLLVIGLAALRVARRR